MATQSLLPAPLNKASNADSIFWDRLKLESDEREQLAKLSRSQTAAAVKVQRAAAMIAMDCSEGAPGLSDAKVAAICGLSVRSLQRLRERVCEVGALGALERKPRLSRMNSAKFIDFLKKLRDDAGRPVIVIADNASYHVSKVVTEFATEPDNEVWVETLPAYAPELNPDEQVWNQAKRRLAKQFIETKKGMERQTMNILLSIQKSRDLIRSFFELDDTRYAKLAE